MKLLLADDHTLFRDALIEFIARAEPDVEITLAKDISEVLNVMKSEPHQDLILLDLKMPGMNGMEGFRMVHDEYPQVPLALMSGMAESGDVRTAMEMGAVGYFPKTLSGKALLKAIHLVLAGEKFVPLDNQNNGIMPAYYNDAKSGASGRTFSGANGGAPIKLTPREFEVLGFLSSGMANKEIANILGLQVVTVKLHVRGVCRKLGAKNRTQAALKAREMGIMQ